MAFTFVADDVPVPIIGATDENEIDLSVIDYGPFEELAINAQRLVVSRAVRNYSDGSMKTPVSVMGKLTNEKIFRLSKLIEWTNAEPIDLVNQLSVGRLRCRLSAKMGMGKSTYLPAYIAREMNFRVCYVTLDNIKLQDSIDSVHDRNFGKYNRAWTNVKKRWLTGMTYADFISIMASSRRSEFFSCFELFVFDEADSNLGDVFAAKSCFAVYAHPETNLILCSATIKKEEVGENGGAAGLGNFKTISSTVTVTEAIASGKLMTDYLVDRTIVFLPDDDAVRQMQEYYESQSIDSYLLDSASSRDEFAAVREKMLGDSATPRVVSAHYSFGIGTNLPVSQCLIFPYYTVKVADSSSVLDKSVFMTEDYVTQCKSRSGRGIVEGSGGAVFGEQRSEPCEIQESEKMSAFVRLQAAGIIPSKNGFWSEQYAMFPNGIDSTLACNLIKICLPVEVAIRFFCSDGRVAKKYQQALTLFCQPDCFLLPSRHDLPNGHENWFSEDFVGSSDEKVSVPLRTTGDLQITVQSIIMIAEGNIAVHRWKPAVMLDLDDGYSSSEERKQRRNKMPTLRRLENAPVIEKALPNIPGVWNYKGSTEIVNNTGSLLDKERYGDAIKKLNSRIVDFHVAEPDIFGMTERAQVNDVSSDEMVVIDYGVGNVESPGGSVVCSLKRSICEKLNLGTMLDRDEAVDLISAVRLVTDRFVASKVFDNYCKSWDSMLKTLNNKDNLRELAKRGMTTETFAIVDKLRGRLSLEATNVLASSNVYKKKFLNMFARLPSFATVMKAINDGKFDKVAQTDGFLNRVRFLKANLDQTLLGAESIGVYLPTYITESQRALPLRGPNVLGYVGDGIQQMPENWKRQITSNLTNGTSLSYPLRKNS